MPALALLDQLEHLGPGQADGEQPHRGGAGQAGVLQGDAVDGRGHGVGDVGGAGLAVEPRQGDLGVQALGGQHPAGHAGRQRRRDDPAEVGVRRVVQPELHAAADVVAQRRPQLGPAVRRDQQVDAVVQARGRDLLEVRVDVVELAPQRGQVVDDQQDVGQRIALEHAPGAPVAVLGHRLDAGQAEAPLALVHQAAGVADRAPHALPLELAAHRADVREGLERAERAAAEVDPVDVQLLGRVGRGEGQDDAPQQRRLARLGRADDGHVAAAAGQVQDVRALRLAGRPVDDADRGRQLGDVAGDVEHPVERQRRLERRQPHLVRRRVVAAALGHRGDQDVHVGLLLAGLLARRP